MEHNQTYYNDLFNSNHNNIKSIPRECIIEEMCLRLFTIDKIVFDLDNLKDPYLKQVVISMLRESV